MSKIQWQDNFNIGIDEIDLQHKKLLQIFNEMYALSTDESQNYRVLIGKTLKNCLLILITIFRKKRISPLRRCNRQRQYGAARTVPP